MDLSSETAFPPWLIYVCIPVISLLDIISEIRYGNHLFQMIYFLVFFFPGADGQKRKKSLRRKLDSLAKEKSKDKGTPSSFNVSSFSPSLSHFALLSLRQVGSPPLGQVNGGVIKTQFLFTGLWQFIFSLSGGTPCKGTGSEKQPLCCTKQSIFGRKRVKGGPAAERSGRQDEFVLIPGFRLQ